MLIRDLRVDQLCTRIQTHATYLGIKTRFRTFSSKSPKNSVPRRYCSGMPLALCFTKSRNIAFLST